MHSVEFFSNGERGRILVFKVFIPLINVFFPVPISTHITMPLDLFSLQKNALQRLKYAYTTVLFCFVLFWKAGHCLRDCIFCYYWIHGYWITGLLKQTGDEYGDVHDFFSKENAVLKHDFLLGKQMLQVSVKFPKESKFGTSFAYSVILKIATWISNIDADILSQI